MQGSHHMCGAIYDALLVSTTPLVHLSHRPLVAMIIIPYHTIVIPLYNHYNYGIISTDQIFIMAARPPGCPIHGPNRALAVPQALHQSHGPAVSGGSSLDALGGGGWWDLGRWASRGEPLGWVG